MSIQFVKFFIKIVIAASAYKHTLADFYVVFNAILCQEHATY